MCENLLRQVFWAITSNFSKNKTLGAQGYFSTLKILLLKAWIVHTPKFFLKHTFRFTKKEYEEGIEWEVAATWMVSQDMS